MPFFVTKFRSISRLNAPRALPISRRRSFHITSARSALNETDRHRDEVYKEIDAHKDDQLEKQKAGKGHWKEELASQSESVVKADREDIDASQDNIEKLQKESTEFIGSKHGDGK